MPWAASLLLAVLPACSSAEAESPEDEGPPPSLCSIEARCDRAIPESEKVACRFRVLTGEGSIVYDDHAGMELRGRSSLEFPKKNYAIELRTPAGAEHPENLLSMGQDADWVLDGSWADRSFMRNDLIFALFRSAGWYAPQSRYCTLSLDGQPRGIYRLSERIKRDDDRVAMSENTGAANSFIIKQDSDGVLRFPLGGSEDRWELVYPKQSIATAAQRAAVQTWLDGLGGALRSSSASASASVFAHLDRDATVDFVLHQELAKNIDAYNLSLHLTRDAGGAARLVPWDLDLSMGQPTLRNQSNESAEGWVYNRTAFISGLSRLQELKSRLAPRWQQLRAGPLADRAVSERLDRFAATLTPAAVEANFAIWPLRDVDFTQIYAPFSLYRVSSYAEETTRLRSWLSQRLQWMDAHIADYPN